VKKRSISLNNKIKNLFDFKYNEIRGFNVVPEQTKYIVFLFFSLVILFSSLVFNSPHEIFEGIINIILAPSILITDYFVVGSLGAAIFNAGFLMSITVFICYFNNVHMNGPVIAAIMTIGGFSFFGKNIFNIWPIIIGVYIHAKFQKEEFSNYIIIALFGTALGPLISQISFGLGITQPFSILLGISTGIFAGFLLPPLANHFISFHQGFSLYNIGFTCGIIGMLFMAILRAFNFDSNTTLIVANGINFEMTIYLVILFTTFLIIGLYFSHNIKNELAQIFEQSGRLVSDFVSTCGFSASLINMALLGYVSILYILFVGGELSGPVIGGIFTVVGFGAFGKHVKNVLPVMIGVFIATFFQIWSVNSTAALLGALFSTTLAPISAYYGWKSGIIAGVIHIAVVMNIGYLHGGMNLYNNGFAGGFVAAILVPILDSIRKEYD